MFAIFTLCNRTSLLIVIPAKAGIHFTNSFDARMMDPRLRGDDNERRTCKANKKPSGPTFRSNSKN